MNPCIGCGVEMPDVSARPRRRGVYCSRACGNRHYRYEHYVMRPLSIARYYQRHLKAGFKYKVPRKVADMATYIWIRDNRGNIRTCLACGVQWCGVRGTGPGMCCSDECSRENERANRRAAKRGSGKTHRKRAKEAGVELGPVNRKRVLLKAGYRCACCDIQCRTDGKYLEDDAPELDHIIPISEGGGHIMDNVQLLCRRCNRMKGTKDDAMFKTLARFAIGNV